MGGWLSRFKSSVREFQKFKHLHCAASPGLALHYFSHMMSLASIWILSWCCCIIHQAADSIQYQRDSGAFNGRWLAARTPLFCIKLCWTVELVQLQNNMRMHLINPLWHQNASPREHQTPLYLDFTSLYFTKLHHSIKSLYINSSWCIKPTGLQKWHRR